MINRKYRRLERILCIHAKSIHNIAAAFEHKKVEQSVSFTPFGGRKYKNFCLSLIDKMTENGLFEKGNQTVKSKAFRIKVGVEHN